MIQLDALLRRPDFVPDSDNNNDNITMLPDNLFVNLINTDLQRRIVNCTTTDKDAAEALITLLKDDPTTMKNRSDDWTLEPFEGKHALFYKNKNYIPPDDEL